MRSCRSSGSGVRGLRGRRGRGRLWWRLLPVTLVRDGTLDTFSRESCKGVKDGGGLRSFFPYLEVPIQQFAEVIGLDPQQVLMDFPFFLAAGDGQVGENV